MKISVIVPVYKAEKYIEECINSVLSQTYRDFELILIDDGSPDRSGAICDEYAERFHQIKVYHKANGGVSSARNLGIDKATGAWILFLDADDKLYDRCLEICIHTALRDNLDLLQFWHSQSKRFQENKYNIPVDSEVFRNMRFNVCVAGNFIKASLIRTHHLAFPESIKLAEDQVFVMCSILVSKRAEIIDNILYYYRINPDSATATINQNEMYLSSLFLLSFEQDNPEFKHQTDNSILSFIYYIALKNSEYDKKIRSLYKRANIQHCDRVNRGGKILYYIAKFNIQIAFLVTRVLYNLRVRSWRN